MTVVLTFCFVIMASSLGLLKNWNLLSMTISIYVCRGSSVSAVITLSDGRSQFYFQQGQGLFLFATAFRPALGPTQPPIQWVPLVFSPGVQFTTHLHLMPRLRMLGAVSPLLHMSLLLVA
jgi:hypothetical protein